MISPHSSLTILTGTRTIQITNNVGHTSLVTHEGSQVNRLLGIILRIGLDTTTVLSGALTGEETQVTVTGSFVLAVRLQ